jgi:hypothetical protein
MRRLSTFEEDWFLDDKDARELRESGQEVLRTLPDEIPAEM